MSKAKYPGGKHNWLKFVYGEQMLDPMPHEGCWLAVQRVMSRGPEGGVLRETEVQCGKWSKGLKSEKLTRAKLAAAKEAFPTLLKALTEENDKLGGGMKDMTTDPNAPRVTGRRGN